MSQLSTAKRCAEKMWAGDSASKALGMEIEIREAGAATARMRVREDMVNGFDICHGRGQYRNIAEASTGTSGRWGFGVPVSQSSRDFSP